MNNCIFPANDSGYPVQHHGSVPAVEYYQPGELVDCDEDSDGEPRPKYGKKTRGRVKIKMQFISNKLRRYTTFSKRKTGIMKKVSSLKLKVCC